MGDDLIAVPGGQHGAKYGGRLPPEGRDDGGPAAPHRWSGAPIGEVSQLRPPLPNDLHPSRIGVRTELLRHQLLKRSLPPL
jgi:hypothetical protein